MMITSPAHRGTIVMSIDRPVRSLCPLQKFIMSINYKRVRYIYSMLGGGEGGKGRGERGSSLPGGYYLVVIP